jgi:hygromycin-B 7''-O-kinase
MRLPPITLAQARTLLLDVSAPENVAAIEQLSGGESGAAHLVTFVDESMPLIVKAYRQNGGGWSLVHEVAAYRLMRRNGITLLPELIAGARAAKSPIDRPYLVMTKLEHVSVEQYVETASDDQITDVYRQVGVLLRQIHDIPQVGFGRHLSEDGNTDPSNALFWQRVFETQVAEFEDQTGDHRTVELARTYVGARTELFDLCSSPVLLHGDLHEGNVIMDSDDDRPFLTGIIDIESAMAGDPVADFARMDTFSMHGSELKRDALFEGYGSTPDEWEQRKRLYQLVQAFEHWNWYHRDGHDDYLPGVIETINELLSA